jgi:hypothetical protein
MSKLSDADVGKQVPITKALFIEALTSDPGVARLANLASRASVRLSFEGT